MVVFFERLWLIYLFIICHAFPVSPIDCAKLVAEDLRAIDRIVVAYGNATVLGRAPSAPSKHLDISSLSDEQFSHLFSKKTALNIGITAFNSKLSNITFPELMSFDDHENRILLRLVNNRKLKNIGLPKLPKSSFFSTNDIKYPPVYLAGNPQLTNANIVDLQVLTGKKVQWYRKNIQNYPGTCVFTSVIRNLSDLDPCRRVSGNLIIDEASGDTTTPYLEVDGFISITNSNITNIDFLSGIKNNYIKDTDVLTSNPALCLSDEKMVTLEVRNTKLIINNNKPKIACENPETTCFGGDLRVAATRSRIESQTCSTIIGDLVIEHIINRESDLTEPLRAGLSRIEQVLNGSVYIIFNEALDKIDFLPNLVKVSPSLYQGCKVPGIDISANFNLTSIQLSWKLVVTYDSNPGDCVLVSIGANGPEGREYGMEEGQMEHLRQQFGKGMKLWTHPRSPAIIKEEIERKERNEHRYLRLLVGSVVSGFCSILAVSFSIYILIRRSRSKNKESEGTDDKTRQSKESKNKKNKQAKKRSRKNGKKAVV